VSTEGTVVFFGLGVPRTPMNWSSSWEKKSFMDISANVSVSSFGLSSFDRLDGGVQTDDGDEPSVSLWSLDNQRDGSTTFGTAFAGCKVLFDFERFEVLPNFGAMHIKVDGATTVG